MAHHADIRPLIGCRAFGDSRKTPPLLFLGALSHIVWRPTISALSSRYAIRQIDFPGFGPSPAPPTIQVTAVSELAEGVRAVMAQESLARAVIVGWSLGAQAAVSLGKLCPDRIAGMILVCGVSGNPFEDEPESRPLSPLKSTVPQAVDWLAGRLERVDRLRYFFGKIENPARWAKRFGLIDPFTDENLFNEMMSAFLQVDLETYSRYTKAMTEHDDTPALEAFSFPILAVSGEKDLIVSPERMKSMCKKAKHCEYFEIIGGTHYLPIEYADLLALKIDAFIKDRCCP